MTLVLIGRDLVLEGSTTTKTKDKQVPYIYGGLAKILYDFVMIGPPCASPVRPLARRPAFLMSLYHALKSYRSPRCD